MAPMDEWHEDGKHSKDLLEGRRPSADVTELIADDNEDAIVPMSNFCARSQSEEIPKWE
jgi:hypothetical protein